MNNTESILTSVKKLLGIDEGYTHFDPDLIMHINSVFSILTQMGVGPPGGLKSYVGQKVRLLFDLPISTAAIESINQQIKEYEFRLFVAADTPT